MMPSLARQLLHPSPEYLGFAMRVGYTAMALLVSILLARLLGPEPLGRYYAVVAWVLLVGGIVQSGWATFLVREVAALREMRRHAELRGLTRTALRIVAALSIASAILFIVIAFGSGDRETFMLVLAGAPIMLLLSTSSLRQAVTRGLGRPLLGQACELVARPGVQLIGLGLLASGLVALRPTPLAAMIIFLAAIATSAILAFLLQAPLMPRLADGERPLLPPRSEWLGPFLRTAVVGWAQAINLQIGTIVLSAMSGDAEIANFRIAQQLATLLAFGLTVVTSLYANEFSRLFVRGETRTLERLAAKGALIGGATALAIGLAFFFGGQGLIILLFGQGFSAAFAPLAVMILGQLVNALFGPVGAVAIATRNEKAAMTAHLASVAVNLLFCALLVPVWGAVGAAVGAAFSLALWNIILFYVIRRRLGISAYAGAFFSRG